MKPLKKWFDSVKNWSTSQTLTILAIASFLAFFLFWILGVVFKLQTFPIEYIQKIPFGILGATVILGAAFVWVRLERPQSWDSLNEKTTGGINDCTPYEKVTNARFWVALFAIIAAVLAFAL